MLRKSVITLVRILSQVKMVIWTVCYVQVDSGFPHTQEEDLQVEPLDPKEGLFQRKLLLKVALLVEVQDVNGLHMRLYPEERIDNVFEYLLK